jgi:magnesium transporter
VVTYDTENYVQRKAQAEEINDLKEASGVKWVHVEGVHDVEVVKLVGAAFNLHPLVLEDILQTKHRPKVEEYGEYLFFALKSLGISSDRTIVTNGHICLILGRDYVVSFSEADDDRLDPIRKRLSSGGKRIRRMGADYLVHALIDVVVDGYFHIVEQKDDLVEQAEEEVFTSPQPETLELLYRLKRMDLAFRRAAIPVREAISFVIREDSDLISETTIPFFRDAQDHLTQLIESVSAQREIVDGLLAIYQHVTANRLNEVTKVLTIVATIFLPLTLIAGIYGMNFKYMPELQWQWGYPGALALMVILAVGMLWLFRRRKWF